MSYTTRKAAIIKALHYATRYANGKIIWANQDMPRPAKPYISANITNMRSIGREALSSPDTDGHSSIRTQKEFYLVLSAFSDGRTDTEELLLNLSDWFLTQEAYEILSPEEIVFVDVVSGPNSMAVKLDSNFEDRSQMEVRMRMPWTNEDQAQGRIEAVSIEGLAFNPAGATVMSHTFAVGTQFTPTDYTLTAATIDSIDTLFKNILVSKGAADYVMAYSASTIVTINAAAATIADLLVNDVATMVYFEYHGAHNLKSISVTRT